MHGIAVYVKEGLPFAWSLSLENSAGSHLCLRLAFPSSVSYFFFLYQLSSLSLCIVFYSISSINPSANLFVFWDFNVHHEDWLTCSGGTCRPAELCYNFSISNDLTQMVDFPAQIPGCDSHSPALLDLFISSDTSIWSIMTFAPLGNSHHVVVLISIDFPTNSKQDSLFHCIDYDHACADWHFLIIWNIFHGMVSLNSELLLLLGNFVSVFRLELLYISLIVSIRWNLTHSHGFQLLVLLP